MSKLEWNQFMGLKKSKKPCRDTNLASCSIITFCNQWADRWEHPNLETNLHLTALADGTEITLHVHSRTALRPDKSQHLSNIMANFMEPVFARNLWSLVAFSEILSTNKILTIPPAASASPA